VREGYRIALVGAPNAGKSSLLNRLVGREAAIVTEHAGTTRDVIEVPAVVAGFKVLFADMAGVRATTDPIEAEGVRRARAWAEAADLRLWVVDKSDLGLAADAASVGAASDLEQLSVSAASGEGLDALWMALSARVERLAGGDFPAVTRLRHRGHLRDAAIALRRGEAALARAPELAAEDLRQAAMALGRIAGRIDAEEVLDVVFSSFCIGK
jgi:tRNA modification GTPase